MRRVSFLAAASALGAVAFACGSFGTSTKPSDPAVDAGAGDGASNEAGSGLATDPALVAHWPLDEGVGIVARDSSGHGRAGTLNKGASWTDGLLGKAVRFDRDAAGNVGAKVPGFGTASVTATAWVKSVDTVSPQSRIFGAILENAYLFLNFNKGFPAVEAQTQAAYWWATADNKSSIADDLWHHVGLVLDRATPETRVFVDGILLAKEPPEVKDAGGDDSFGSATKTSDFLIGSQNGDVAVEFGGTIDDVWLFLRVLDETEIATLARRP